jgi:hypothetical protein
VETTAASATGKAGQGVVYWAEDGTAREKGFDFGARHIGSQGRFDQADDASSYSDSTCSHTHDPYSSLQVVKLQQGFTTSERNSTRGTAALRDFDQADVRFGSKADKASEAK